MGDVIISTAISVMFARKLLALHFETIAMQMAVSSQPASSSQCSSSKELAIATKSTLLTCVAVFTSEFAVILTSLSEIGHIWFAADCIVNTWCILLIFKQYAPIYDRMCGLFQRIITQRLLQCYSCHCCCPIESASAS